MTSFEVDDRFAGKKGPCPKCGHLIEIPKEKLVIHAPDDITEGGKTRKNVGHDARPIQQRLFTLSGRQVAVGFGGVVMVFLLSYLVGLAHSPVLSTIIGALLAFGIAFPIADFGYMLIRDENDLEIYLGNERHIRALKAAVVFAASWIVFELFVHFLGGTGLFACLYLIPIAAIGSFGALIFFDCNFGSALLVYLMFAFSAIICRGLIYTDGMKPNGWIWQRSSVAARQNPRANKPKKADAPAAEDSAAPATDSKADNNKKPAEKPASNEPKETSKPTLNREAPKIDQKDLNRRRR